MVPPNLTEATVIHAAADGEYTILEPIVTIQFADGTDQGPGTGTEMADPYSQTYPPALPCIVYRWLQDSVSWTPCFPIAKGGTAAVPGGFGTGKTMTQHQIAKWSDADIIIYIGCGERGNEMTQVLEEFSELIDPEIRQSC